jgi:hypothetical protein
VTTPVILGCMGGAGSGKDMVADWFVANLGFTRIAYADVMKRLAARVFNFSETQLWGPSEERNKDVGTTQEQWEQYEENFRGCLETYCADLQNGTMLQSLLAQAMNSWFKKLRVNYGPQGLTVCPSFSARIVLQLMGTEMGRDFYPNIWIKYVHDVVIPEVTTQGASYTAVDGIQYKPGNSAPTGFVIPDHLFVNEMKYTQSKGGYVIRVRRLAKEASDSQVGLQGHASEAEQQGIKDEQLDLVLKCNEGQESVYKLLNAVWERKLYAAGKGTIAGPDAPNSK